MIEELGKENMCYHSGQSGPESDGNEGVLRIPHSSSITGTS